MRAISRRDTTNTISLSDTLRITPLNFFKSKVDFQKTLFEEFLCFKKFVLPLWAEN